MCRWRPGPAVSAIFSPQTQYRVLCGVWSCTCASSSSGGLSWILSPALRARLGCLSWGVTNAGRQCQVKRWLRPCQGARPARLGSRLPLLRAHNLPKTCASVRPELPKSLLENPNPLDGLCRSSLMS
ncbi:hypothetical protein DPEC_G00270150 [Dallia pectoralis]|uniref:Uncharacterized protein n=1 Tax=Dallia pectoralis TaxID=75939 RepID=A0ACC2FPB3_DALPE|nr:hypothetical protein DPEC_G00270150 [Dallia pectoralis]